MVFRNAESRDLDSWQRRIAEERLSALAAIHREVAHTESGSECAAERNL